MRCQGPPIRFQHFRRDRRRQVLLPQRSLVEVRKRSALAGPLVERRIPRESALDQTRFVIRCRRTHRGADPHPYPPPIPHRRIPRRLDEDRRDLPAVQPPLLDDERRHRHDAAIVPSRRQPVEQFVIDRRTGNSTIVFDADQQDSGFAVSRQVVRERADVPANRLRVVHRTPTLDPIGFETPRQLRDPFIRVRRHRRSTRAASRDKTASRPHSVVSGRPRASDSTARRANTRGGSGLDRLRS